MTTLTETYTIVVKTDGDTGETTKKLFYGIDEGFEYEYDIIDLHTSHSVVIFDDVYLSPYRNINVSVKSTNTPKHLRDHIFDGSVKKALKKLSKKKAQLFKCINKDS